VRPAVERAEGLAAPTGEMQAALAAVGGGGPALEEAAPAEPGDEAALRRALRLVLSDAPQAAPGSERRRASTRSVMRSPR